MFGNLGISLSTIFLISLFSTYEFHQNPLPKSITDWKSLEPNSISILSYIVQHNTIDSWYIPSFNQRYSIGWNRSVEAGFLGRPFACGVKAFGVGHSSTLEGYEDGGTGFLTLEFKDSRNKMRYHGFDSNETNKIHCYYMSTKNCGSDFLDTPKTVGLAIYCPVYLDFEIGYYSDSGHMQTGFYCRILSDTQTTLGIHLRTTNFIFPENNVVSAKDKRNERETEVTPHPWAERELQIESIQEEEQSLDQFLQRLDLKFDLSFEDSLTNTSISNRSTIGSSSIPITQTSTESRLSQLLSTRVVVIGDPLSPQPQGPQLPSHQSSFLSSSTSPSPDSSLLNTDSSSQGQVQGQVQRGDLIFRPSKRSHAVCTVQTFKNPISGYLLFMFVSYYQLMGWTVIVYDRFGLHKDFLLDLLSLPGVYYHPNTLYQLADPKKYSPEDGEKLRSAGTGSASSSSSSFGFKYFYPAEKGGATGVHTTWTKVSDTADQDADKTRTYDYCRMEYSHLDTILFIDSDEFFFCPQANSQIRTTSFYQPFLTKSMEFLNRTIAMQSSFHPSSSSSSSFLHSHLFNPHLRGHGRGSHHHGQHSSGHSQGHSHNPHLSHSNSRSLSEELSLDPPSSDPDPDLLIGKRSLQSQPQPFPSSSSPSSTSSSSSSSHQFCLDFPSICQRHYHHHLMSLFSAQGVEEMRFVRIPFASRIEPILSHHPQHQHQHHHRHLQSWEEDQHNTTNSNPSLDLSSSSSPTYLPTSQPTTIRELSREHREQLLDHLNLTHQCLRSAFETFEKERILEKEAIRSSPQANRTTTFPKKLNHLSRQPYLSLSPSTSLSRGLRSLFSCWSSASSFDSFPKSADFASVCPFHYNHWSCDGLKAGGRDLGGAPDRPHCRCKVGFEMFNELAYAPMRDKCYLAHLNTNNYRIQSRRQKHVHDDGSVFEYHPIYHLFS